MELFLHQVLAGLATGGIYACMALAVVMIYQAIDHLNFAQGEMAMFSTFIAWQLIQWGFPYWLAFAATIVHTDEEWRAMLTPDQYLVQRRRWGMGAMQILVRERLWAAKRWMSWRNFHEYLNGTLWWLEGIATLVAFLVPIAVAFRFRPALTAISSAVTVVAYLLQAVAHPAHTRQQAARFIAVQAGYLLTGETRSSVGIVKPLHPLDPRPGHFGLGAFELTGRYDYLNVGREAFTLKSAICRSDQNQRLFQQVDTKDGTSWTHNLRP